MGLGPFDLTGGRSCPCTASCSRSRSWRASWFRIGSAPRAGGRRYAIPASLPIWPAVRQAATAGAAAIDRKSVRDGLLVGRDTTWRMRLLQTVPYLLPFVFGAIKWEIGALRGRPIGYLAGLLAWTMLFALLRYATLDRRTRGGMAVLAETRTASSRLRRAPVADETGLAVALYGTTVLSGSIWGDYHTMRTASSGDGGASGGGS